MLPGRQAIGSMLLVALCAVACGAPEDPVEPSQRGLNVTYNSPYGSEQVTVVIGHPEGIADHWLVWVRHSDSHCTWVYLGGALQNDLIVNLSPANDYGIVPATSGFHYVGCSNGWNPGYFMKYLAPNQGTHSISFYGQDGNDLFYCNGNPVYCHGGNGDDIFDRHNPTGYTTMYGGNGNDMLIARSSNPELRMFGEAGADCLQAPASPPPAFYDCGEGAGDRSAGVQGSACESTVPYCP